jgi:GTP cyclohydrolase I
MTYSKNLPDVQLTVPNIQLPIQMVGVETVEVPFKLEKKVTGFNDTIALASIRVNLIESQKGISMSRLLLTLNKYLNQPLKHKLIKIILEDLCKTLEADNGFIKLEFKMPIIRKSIKTDNEFPIYHECKFEGQLINNNFKFYEGVLVQYASYCPCSAELCRHLNKYGENGHAHAQRSYAELLVEVKEPNIVWLEDLIEIIEKSVIILPYPIIKRIDEMEIARVASSNPMFVEDAIRKIMFNLNQNDLIYDYIIKCTHEESIHTSEAIAVCWKGITNGLNGNYYL